MNAQKNIAAQIVAQKGDYVLALKGNHGLLYEDVSEFFRWLGQKPGGLKVWCDASEQTCNWGHGRFEERRCYCLAVTEQDWPQAKAQWPHLKSLVCLESGRRSSTTGPEEPKGAQS